MSVNNRVLRELGELIDELNYIKEMVEDLGEGEVYWDQVADELECHSGRIPALLEVIR